MVRRALWIGLMLLLGCAAFAQKPEDVLLKADRDFSHDVQTKRLEGFLPWIAPGIVTFGSTNLKGLDEVRKTWKEAFDDADFQLSWEPAKAEMFPSGTMGYTTGRFTILDKAMAGPTVTKGTYLTVWQKQKDGSWKVLADGGSPDEPVWKE
ncbi:hypothetical protein Acid345_2192 [Candidatus Koribacter versatilis Ellin345]|uniref:DUF4440 domain-containing protein n=1 Tax=Koribacter versatilis (strain Ellin345) TaxID=204669 RepID=Q1IPK7_KORVE|nr:nuclear transport factor 2 family protein [Candidatus Koribacter versatilis]ABF41193.1 hypothetical protein Acid345_2192 [Candidatus Koribacter versatilis Ellin345]